MLFLIKRGKATWNAEQLPDPAALRALGLNFNFPDNTITPRVVILIRNTVLFFTQTLIPLKQALLQLQAAPVAHKPEEVLEMEAVISELQVENHS